MISVVMPVYDAEKYLDEAIQSILNQTYKDFEFIIINDGSTDKSLEIIEKYKRQDKRIVLITRENKGLVASLNEGIRISKGEYIARMDADDISFPSRFEEQISFMKTNLDIAICGSSVQLFNEDENFSISRYPQKDNEIKFTLMFMSSFAHPAVMIRRVVFDTLKYENLEYAEDYQLWTDIAIANFKMANLDKVLLKYRWHDEQISQKNGYKQREKSFEISKMYLSSIKGAEVIRKNLIINRNDSTPKNLYYLFHDINKYRKKIDIPDKYYLGAIRIILRMSNPIGLNLYLTYRKFSKNINKDKKYEIYLFLQSVFHLNRESTMYQFIAPQQIKKP